MRRRATRLLGPWWRWDNVALMVFEAASETEAQQIVKDDPAVKAYVFQAQVRPFDVHFITNKYDAGAGAS